MSQDPFTHKLCPISCLQLGYFINCWTKNSCIIQSYNYVLRKRSASWKYDFLLGFKTSEQNQSPMLITMYNLSLLLSISTFLACFKRRCTSRHTLWQGCGDSAIANACWSATEKQDISQNLHNHLTALCTLPAGHSHFKHTNSCKREGTENTALFLQLQWPEELSPDAYWKLMLQEMMRVLFSYCYSAFSLHFLLLLLAVHCTPCTSLFDWYL